MTKAERKAGALLRKVAKLDRTWRAEGRVEGRTENSLAFTLGQAYRKGLGRQARRIQNRNVRSGMGGVLYPM